MKSYYIIINLYNNHAKSSYFDFHLEQDNDLQLSFQQVEYVIHHGDAV